MYSIHVVMLCKSYSLFAYWPLSSIGTNTSSSSVASSSLNVSSAFLIASSSPIHRCMSCERLPFNIYSSCVYSHAYKFVIGAGRQLTVNHDSPISIIFAS